MPKISQSSFIKATSARYNGKKGNLLLSADGLSFVPDDGGKELKLPIETLMDASIEGMVRKRVCVVVNGSNERHLFYVSDFKEWSDSISLAAGIYRRIAAGMSRKSSKKQAKPQNQAAAKTPSPPRSPPRSTTNSQNQSKTSPPLNTKTTVASRQSAQSSPPSPPYTGPWPSGQDYEQSFQIMSASISRKLGDVANWAPVKNPKTPGWYVYASGNYGSIYKIKNGNGGYFALKCFTRKSSTLNERYLKISDYLSGVSKGINFLAQFNYFQEGIKTKKSQTHLFPLLKMEWLDGVTLNKYINSHIDDPKSLRKISQNLVSEIAKLQKAGISHGDLAGDNIIVTNEGMVKLVDYDGMYIPDFKGQKSSEMGHADFQHPARSADTFSERLDNFSALVIHLSLTAISMKPDLWDRFNGDDPDCLILRKHDFLNLDISPVFTELSKLRDKRVKKMCSLLREHLSNDPLWDGANASALSAL